MSYEYYPLHGNITYAASITKKLNPNFLAAPYEQSNILPSTYGPLSLILNIMDLLLSKLVTLTTVPKGKVLCAAVTPY